EGDGREVGGGDRPAAAAARRETAHFGSCLHAGAECLAPARRTVVVVAADVEAEIPAHRPGVADLRARDELRGAGQRSVGPLERWMRDELADPHARTD